MDNSLSKGATDWREGRRLRAFELKQQGWSQQHIAEALGVSKGAVSQWMKRARDGGGAEALKRQPAPGARPRLSEDQRARLPELLARGVQAHGFRQEVAFAQKGAQKEGRTIVFSDQSGFYLLPAVVRTYAPVGQTPILKEHLSRDHLSAMSAITLDGKLYMKEQERAFKGEDVVRFLKHLMRQIPGRLLLIWDGSPIHRGGAVKDFLASGASKRLKLEQLPGYAPDLNPDEGIWKHLKCVELKNLCCESLAELKIELRKAKERLRHKREVILGCIRQPGFEV
jgi:transposase